MATTLEKLQKGQSARVSAVNGSDTVTQRILALGLLPGTQVTIVGVAPLGDPITVQSSAGRVSLRRVEASAIEVELQTQQRAQAAP